MWYNSIQVYFYLEVINYSFSPIFWAPSNQFLASPLQTRGSVGWACVAHLSFCFEETLYRTFHRCFLPNFCSFGYLVSEDLEITTSKNCLWCPWPCLLMDRDEMSNLNRGPFIDPSYQVSVHYAKRFQRRRFLKSTNQKQELPVVDMFVNGWAIIIEDLS